MRTKDHNVYVYIDGFNVYHSLARHLEQSPSLNDSYKWINPKELVSNYLEKSEIIESIKFFSAIPEYSSDKGRIKRHKKYVRVLQEHCDTKVILGRFGNKKVSFKCSHCKKYVSLISCKKCNTELSTQKHEEKETDVSIGIETVHDILTKKKNIHKIIIVSNDTDFMPIIRYILEHTSIKILILAPLGSANAGQFSDIAKKEQRVQIKKISEKSMSRARMPSTIRIGKQNIISPYTLYT